MITRRLAYQSARRGGFTLIELVVVVGLIAFMASLVSNNFGMIATLQQQNDLRAFTQTWQFLGQQALATQSSFRLVIDLDRNSYFIREEILEERAAAKQVDYLANLRTQSEKRRRQEKANTKLKSLDEEYAEQDKREQHDLQRLFFESIFRDPYGNVRLSLPLESPTLGEERILRGDLRFRDVKVHGETAKKGQVVIRCSPNSGCEFAVVHLVTGPEDNTEVYSLVMTPTTGTVQLLDRDVDYEWSLFSDSNKHEK